METKFSPLYESFRELMDNRHRWNLRAELLNYRNQGRLKEGVLMPIEVGPPLVAVLFVCEWKGTVHLLGGYWKRHGEPKPELLAALKGYVRDIVAT